MKVNRIATPSGTTSAAASHHTPAGYVRASGYTNPWPQRRIGLLDLHAAWISGIKEIKSPADEVPVKVVKPEFSKYPGSIRGVWIGHASFLLIIPQKSPEQQSLGVLFDPVFAQRCSPSQLVGPSRFIPPPCTIEELPPIHMVLISHNHYDHLSTPCILKLWELHRATVHFFVPLGNKSWFTSCGIDDDRIIEFDWWDEVEVAFNDSVILRVASTPAQHSSGRGLRDQSTTLWCSWMLGITGDGEVYEDGSEDESLREVVVSREKQMREVASEETGGAINDTSTDPTAVIKNIESHQSRKQTAWDSMKWKMYFGGDTGYRLDPSSSTPNPLFPLLAHLFSPPSSPLSLSLLPISPGSTLSYIHASTPYPFSTFTALDSHQLTALQHMDPTDAMACHVLLGSKRSLGIHYGTFVQNANESWGIKEWFMKEKERLDKADTFELWDVGKVVLLSDDLTTPVTNE